MLNRAILIGRLVADPELRVTPNGVSVATFRIAIDRPYAPKGGERQADFLNIVAWRNQAEFAGKYFKKGSDICIEGSIQTRDYEKDGIKRYMTEIVADNIRFVGRKSNNDSGYSQDQSFPTPPSEPRNNPAPSYSSGSAGDFEVVDNDDDLPF